MLERNAKAAGTPDLATLFKFEVEDRLQCAASKQVG